MFSERIQRGYWKEKAYYKIIDYKGYLMSQSGYKILIGDGFSANGYDIEMIISYSF